MESTSMILVAPNENGGSPVREKGDPVIVEEKVMTDVGDIAAGVSVNQSEPTLESPEDEARENLPSKSDEPPPDLDEFASDEVIAESTVVASVNGDQVTLVHYEISTDHGLISAKTEEISGAIPELSGTNILVSSEEPKVDDVVETESRNKEELVVENVSTPEEVTEENVESVNKLSEQSDAEVGKSGRKKKQKKDGGSLQGDESGGKEPTKGRFAIQADLNINSRPKRSVPRRSVFEMLQGEIRPSGHSKRPSTDTGSESDPEPGPSKRTNSRRSRVSTNERLEAIDEGGRSRREKSQDVRRDQQAKRKSQEGDDETMIRDSNKSYKKKSLESSYGTERLAEEQAPVFMADDFDLVETVVGADDQSARDVNVPTNQEGDDDNLTLASIRKENLQRSSECEPSDDRNAPCNDSGADNGIGLESNFEDLEYNSRWHSYATPRRLESPASVPETNQSTKDQEDGHQSRASAVAGLKKTDQKYQDVQLFETDVIEDKEKSGTPWYLASSNETFSSAPKALQSRIDELLKANAELRSRMKEVEGKTSTKKFNIDFHSRKFSKAREPVFGSPADRKSAVSLGKTGTSVERGSGASSLEKDLKEKEAELDRREEKLRAFDVELDERTVQLKANEGKLMRTERRLMEIEKTLEYRERVLKRMEVNIADKEESEKKGDDVPDNPEQLPDQATSSAAETDGTNLERKEQELERLRRFLSEEREKLLPKQQRLTRWETLLRKKEYELQLREQRLASASVSRKRRISGSDEESDSDEDYTPRKTLNAKSATSVQKRHLTAEKRKVVQSSKVFKRTTKTSPSTMNKSGTPTSDVAPRRMNAVVGKKEATDGKPLKEYKLRKRC